MKNKIEYNVNITQDGVIKSVFKQMHGEVRHLDPIAYKAAPLSGEELMRFRARMFLKKQGKEFSQLTFLVNKPVLSVNDISVVLEIEEKLKNYVAKEANTPDTGIKEMTNE